MVQAELRGLLVSSETVKATLHKEQPKRGCAYLNGQGCLAYTSIAQHHQLIQSHFARHVGCSGVKVR
jgi:hypothetical protein